MVAVSIAGTYTSVVTKVTIPSIYETYKNCLSKDFLPHESLSTLWFNYKNHFRTEQIVALANNCPISIHLFLQPLLSKSEYNSPREYHRAICDAVLEYLKVETGYDGARARSNQEAERICDLVYSSTLAISRSIFTDFDSRTTESPSSIAPHVFEYFSYLPIVAAAHVLGDIASRSPFWWYANQVATLVLVTDAITEYNAGERTSPYGAIFQSMTADLLYDLRELENVFQAITSFTLTGIQGLPSVIDAGFWEHDSDLEHTIDQISGSEQNAALCLFRKMFLQCNEPFTMTVLTCPQTVETSRRLYRYLRECTRVTSQLSEDATIVCSCETSICFRPKLDTATKEACYSVTTDGLPCWRQAEVLTVCAIWFISVLATFFGLAFHPDLVDAYNIDPAGTASLVVLYMGMMVSGYKMLRTDLWSWYDFVRGRYYSKSFDDCPFAVDRVTVVRVINDDHRHFAPLTSRLKNSFLMGERNGDFEFDVGITMSDMRGAGIMNYTDGSANYVFDPYRRDCDGLTLHKVWQIPGDRFHIDDVPVRKVRPIRTAILNGLVA
ncbi:hypothetical protein BGZ54_000497 [Gamsiella multidivaricata]|nr:hypothetical protein BGZ54_000497 [Gamsiella multidivaricata]